MNGLQLYSPKLSTTQHSLLFLPQDVLTLIFLRLPSKDIRNIRATCKKIAGICKSNQFRVLYRTKWFDITLIDGPHITTLEKTIERKEYEAKYRVGDTHVQFLICKKRLILIDGVEIKIWINSLEGSNLHFYVFAKVTVRFRLIELTIVIRLKQKN